MTLERICKSVRYPTTIRVDQGSEFISREHDLWAYQKGVVRFTNEAAKLTDLLPMNMMPQGRLLPQNWGFLMLKSVVVTLGAFLCGFDPGVLAAASYTIVKWPDDIDKLPCDAIKG